MSEFLSEDSELSSECEASNLVRRAAEPREAGESVKAAIGRAARRLHWSITRTRAIWYAEARRIDSHEMDQLRALARQQAERHTRIAAALAATDPEFHQLDIAAHLSAARQLGGEDQS